MTHSPITRYHRDSHSPHYPDRERLAKTLLTEQHPNLAWLLVSEETRMKFRAYAEAVMAREEAEKAEIEALVAMPPLRESIINRGKGDAE